MIYVILIDSKDRNRSLKNTSSRCQHQNGHVYHASGWLQLFFAE